ADLSATSRPRCLGTGWPASRRRALKSEDHTADIGDNSIFGAVHILSSVTLALLLVAAPALGSQPSAPSGDPPAGTVLRHVEEVYYEVTGQTVGELAASLQDRKSTRLNSSHV